MPFIIGHGLASTFIYWLRNKTILVKEWKLLGFYIFCGICPDLDFIPGILIGHPNRYHHGLSHSFIGSFVISLILYGFFRLWKKNTTWKDFFFIWGLVSFHCFLDIYSVDTSYPYGCPLFYPYAGYIISPWVFFQDIHRGSLQELFGPHNRLAMAIELGVFAPPVIAAYLTQAANNRIKKWMIISIWIVTLTCSTAVIYTSTLKTLISGNKIIFVEANTTHQRGG
ncbi:MAG: metal-dependent hydrolase [Chlamydiota bacterium]|nr:metal-dependent hydrolase [Chlamydiota bacterium]